jgi:hypothetical protein
MVNLMKFLGGLSFIGLAIIGCLTLVGNGNVHFAIAGLLLILASFIIDASEKGKK